MVAIAPTIIRLPTAYSLMTNDKKQMTALAS
jgi:hypothetical protein